MKCFNIYVEIIQKWFILWNLGEVGFSAITFLTENIQVTFISRYIEFPTREHIISLCAMHIYCQWMSRQERCTLYCSMTNGIGKKSLTVTINILIN